MLHVLVDGDILRYRCAFASEKTQYLLELHNPSGHTEFQKFDTKKGATEYLERVSRGVTSGLEHTLWSRKDVQPVENCLQIIKSTLQGILDDIRNNHCKEDKKLQVRVFLSGKNNFREQVAVTKPYKGNREEAVKPVHFKAAGDYLVTQWSAETTDGYEADDAIGIAATEAREKKEQFLIVSYDKDLDQIPGWHYNWVSREFYNVSAKEAKTQFYRQLLSGDATDNIPGLPGIGPVKASEALAECKSPKEMMEIVAKMYNDPVEPWWDYLAEQADLVYILKKPGEPWTETKEGKEFCTKYLSPSVAS